MKKLLLVITFLLPVISYAQEYVPNILDARRHGVEITKAPSKGILRIEVSEEYANIVQVFLCDFRGSFPIACREDYSITLTTATGNVRKITDYKARSLGKILPEEFPLRIDVKVKGLNGEERFPLEFSVKLLYKDFCYRIYLYDEWTDVKGGVH
jgi:hypothetical protein